VMIVEFNPSMIFCLFTFASNYSIYYADVPD